MPDREMRFIVTAETQRYRRELQKAQEENRKLREELAKTNTAEREGAEASEERSGALKDSTAETRKARTEERAHRTDMGRSTESVKRLTAEERKRWAVQQELRKAQLELAKAETEYSRALNSSKLGETERTATALKFAKALDRVDLANRNVSDSTRGVSRDNDSLTRSLRGATAQLTAAGGSGRGLTRVFTALGGEMGAARQEGKNFAAVLRTLKIPLIVGGVYSLVGAISALAAGVVALIPNLVQASSILAGLPGLIFGVVQAVGVGALAFSGIGDAVKALADRQAAAKESANEQAQAQEALASAQKASAEAIESAEENVADAHDAVREAQERLTEAREEARETLEDLRFEVEQASISEERAQISVIEARRALQEMLKEGGTDVELRSARLDLREAELGVKQARDASKDSQEDLREAEKKGVNGSDQVVAAQEALADATEASADAQEALNETMKSSAASVAAAREDLTGMTSEQEKLKEAFRALTPEARAFAKQLFEMRPLLDQLRATAQRGVLPGAGDALARLTVLFPMLDRAVASTGETLGRFFRNLAVRITTPEWIRDLPLLFEQSDYVIRRAGEALGDILDIFRDFMVAARPVTIWLTDTIAGWIEYVRAATEAGRESGRLTSFFEEAIETAEQLGRILGDVIVGLVNVFAQGAEVGAEFWDQIEEGAAFFRRWTEDINNQNAIKDWFEAAKPAIEAAVRLVGELGRAFFRIAGESTGGLAELFDLVRTRLIPALETLGASVSKELLPAFVELVAQIVEFFSVMGRQGGTLSVFFKTLSLVLDVVNTLVKVPIIKWLLGVAFAIQGVVSATRLLGGVIKASFIGAFLDADSSLRTKLIPTLVLLFTKFQQLLSFLRQGNGITAALNLVGGNFGNLGKLMTIFKVNLALAGAEIAATPGLLAKLGTAIKVFVALVQGSILKMGVFGAAIVLVGVAIQKTTEFLNKDNDMAVEWVDQIRENTMTIGELGTAIEETANQDATWTDKIDGDQTILDGYQKTLETITAEYQAMADATLTNTQAHERWSDQIVHSGNLTTSEREELSRYINALYQYGDGLTETQQLQLQAAIEAGNMGTAMSILEQDLHSTGTEVEAFAAIWDDTAQRMEQARRAVVESFSGQKRDIAPALQELGTNFGELNEGIQEAYGQSAEAGDAFVTGQIEQLEGLREAYRSNFDAVGDAFQTLSGEATVSADEIYAAFQEQLDLVNEYDENWKTLEKRGAPEAVLDQLRALGLDGAAVIEGLANSSEEDFDRTIAKMTETQDASIGLADDVNKELSKSIESLIKVLKQLRDMQAIELGIDIDTSLVKDKVNDLIARMQEKGFTLTESVTAARGRGFGGVGASAVFGHTGGAVPGGLTEGPGGAPKSNEVDARLLVGEYVFSKEAVEHAGGLSEMERIHRALRGGLRPMDPTQIDPHTGEPKKGGFRQRRSGRTKFHDGGAVFGGGVQIDERFLGAGFALPALYRDIGTNTISGQVFAKLKPTGWEIAFDDGNTKGTGTPGMNALNNWIHKHFNVNGTNTVAGPNRFINFNAANGLSQHAFGNAGDYTGQFGSMNALFHGIVRAAESRMIRTLGHAIFNRQAWSYNEQNIGPYTGSIPHTDHAHIDALPQYAGPWPGHPVPPAQYHDGGIVKRSGMVHPGELVFDSQVTDNFVKALTRGGGFLAPLPSISAAQTRSSLVDDSPGSEPNGGQGTTMEVALDVDGVRMSRVVELHSRRNKVLLPSRSRR